jgi:hypothetical protein
LRTIIARAIEETSRIRMPLTAPAAIPCALSAGKRSNGRFVLDIAVRNSQADGLVGWIPVSLFQTGDGRKQTLTAPGVWSKGR